MYTCAAHHVGAGVQQVGDPFLKGYEFDETKTGINEVEKQIDIAPGSGFVSRGRAKQVEARCAQAFQVERMATQSGENLIPFHTFTILWDGALTKSGWRWRADDISNWHGCDITKWRLHFHCV
jgi:hypothetical protein